MLVTPVMLSNVRQGGPGVTAAARTDIPSTFSTSVDPSVSNVSGYAAGSIRLNPANLNLVERRIIFERVVELAELAVEASIS
ncbi:hypothetical protein K0M31_014713 [Melipona bicolor]|uniref:Uncharacterized protein n=1 Tax=Melipona bicolor TaxID=60889 RepID=A0AA40FGQ1_9HYME|nr:hypothetical protein K0M31_014713 [Melipona bicolor]